MINTATSGGGGHNRSGGDVLYKPVVYNQNVVAYMNGVPGNKNSESRTFLPRINDKSSTSLNSGLGSYHSGHDSPYKNANSGSKTRGLDDQLE